MMGYLRVDSSLAENGVAVDILNDGTLFVLLRSSSSKIVEAERQRQQAPYRNIILSGRPMQPAIARELGQKITANAVVVGCAGTLPDGTACGRVVEGKPVEFGKVEPDALIKLFNDFPDFQEDVSNASQTNATFAAPGDTGAIAAEEQPSKSEAVGKAAKN
jgi:hypothetical protein